MARQSTALCLNIALAPASLWCITAVYVLTSLNHIWVIYVLKSAQNAWTFCAHTSPKMNLNQFTTSYAVVLSISTQHTCARFPRAGDLHIVGAPGRCVLRQPASSPTPTPPPASASTPAAARAHALGYSHAHPRRLAAPAPAPAPAPA
jgi:hypothetical protein